MSTFQKFLLKAFVVFCLVNITGLWTVTLVQYRYLLQLQNLQLMSAQLGTQSAARLPNKFLPTPTPVASPASSVLPKASPSPTPSPSPVVSPSPAVSPSTTKPTPASPKPIQVAVVFLGTGATTDSTWVNIPGAAVTIDPAAYGQIIDLQFEAALSILGGEAQARLVNSGTGAIISAATVFNNTSTATWITSPRFEPFTTKTDYMVQLRSTSNENAQLDGARIIIRYRPL